jgi:acetyltransferase-like isoleucine patch superfamily enzyme
VVVGSSSLPFIVKYELLTSLLASFPGALGLWLRQKLYPGLLARSGRKVIFGKGMILHHPRKISLGDRAAISYSVTLDARGDQNRGIYLGDDVIIGQNTALVCKDGDIEIGSNVGIGMNSTINAVAGNTIRIGDDALIAPYTYIGGVSYHFDRTDLPINRQGLNLRGGVTIGEGAWLGARVTVVDGVVIGEGAIIAAGAVVTGDIPPFAIAVGIPAKVQRMRNQEVEQEPDWQQMNSIS